jgi:hypothetical protein
MIIEKEKPATVSPVSGLRKTDIRKEPHDGSEPKSDRQEFVLATLRCASLRVRLIDQEITSAGLALKSGMISSEMALEWVEEVAPGILGAVAESLRKPQKMVEAA